MSVQTRQQKRSLKNYFLFLDIQMPLIISILTLTVVFTLSAIFCIYINLDNSFDHLIALGFVSEPVAASIVQQWNIIFSWIFMLFVVYGLGIISCILIFSHRMLGPNIAFIRHLQQILQENYAVRTKLRKKDAYKNIADLLNKVSESLETKIKKTNT